MSNPNPQGVRSTVEPSLLNLYQVSAMARAPQRRAPALGRNETDAERRARVARVLRGTIAAALLITNGIVAEQEIADEEES